MSGKKHSTTRWAAWSVVLTLSAALGCSPRERGEVSISGPETGASTEEQSAVRSPEDASVRVMSSPDLNYNAREGRRLYRYYCAPCHGDEGHGDGFNAYNLDPKPRDLADPEFQEQRTDEEISAIVRSGGGVAGLSTGMPPWGRTLNDRQIENLTSYLRFLQTPPAEP